MSKVRILEEESHFHPVTLQIELESQKEVDCLYMLMNYSPLAEAMREYLNTRQPNDALDAKIRESLRPYCKKTTSTLGSLVKKHQY